MHIRTCARGRVRGTLCVWLWLCGCVDHVPLSAGALAHIPLRANVGDVHTTCVCTVLPNAERARDAHAFVRVCARPAGQTRTVHVTRMAIKGTVEERILELQVHGCACMCVCVLACVRGHVHLCDCAC